MRQIATAYSCCACLVVAARHDEVGANGMEGQIEDLMTEFWASEDISAVAAQARYADIISKAD